MNKIPCYYTLAGINYKNGFVTSCPQQPDRFFDITASQTILPSEIINSTNFRNHRKEMMSGQWSKGCHLCKDVEENNAGKSMRTNLPIDNYLRYFTIDSHGSIGFEKLRHVELLFSNACNMACLHCSTVYSSGWMTKLKNYQATDEDRFYGLHQLTREMHGPNTSSIDLDINQVERIVNDLNNNFPNIEMIDFAGGEPLYQKQFLLALQLLSNHPNAKNILITFHTNFNVDFNAEELSEILSKFRSSRIMISVDSGKNIYPYFRTGNWDKLVSNISKFRSVNNFSNLNAVCTTSIYQMMDIEDVFKSLLTLDVDYIDSSIVYTPKYLNPALILWHLNNTLNAIESIKQQRYNNLEESKKLRSWADEVTGFTDITSATSSLQRIIDYVSNTNMEYKHYHSFLKFVSKTDILWKQNFNDIFTKFNFVNNELIRIK